MAETYERQRRQAFANLCAKCHNGFRVEIDSGHTLVFALLKIMAEHNSENLFADIQADRGHFPEKVEDSQALSISDREYIQMWSDILVTISAMLKL